MPRERMSYGWGNYLKPSPANVQYFALAVKGMIAGIGGTTLLMESDKWVTFWIFFVGLVLDELAKFAGRVSHGDTDVVSVEVPSELRDQVTVHRTTITEEEKEKLSK